VAGIEAVRRAVGDRLQLMVDANQGWRMPWDDRAPWQLKDALLVAHALAELEVYWLEEPLNRSDFDGMAELRRQARVRIAGGEMARELHDLAQLIDRSCLDVLQPDAVLVGGITGLARIGRLAQQRHLTFTPHTWGNGLGLMANAQLVGGIGGCPYLEFPYDPAGWTLDRRDFMLRAPIVVDQDGFVTLSDAPGLGIELDEDRLAATALRRDRTDTRSASRAPARARRS
jgi:L-alanine-DL-glutamate epimerase-like enolase superfamily enzyme